MDLDEKIDFSPGSQARKIISQEFYSTKWTFFKDWLFKNYSKEELQEIQNKFYEHLSSINQIIHFIPWFTYTFLHDIHNIERDYTLSGDKIITSIFPPQIPFTITNNNVTIKFSAYQKLFEEKTLTVDINHINSMIQQLNFHNLYSIIIGEQLMDLHKKIEKINSQKEIIIQKKRKKNK